jgi:hypothetical protein
MLSDRWVSLFWRIEMGKVGKVEGYREVRGKKQFT